MVSGQLHSRIRFKVLSVQAARHLVTLFAAGIFVDRMTAGVALPLALLPVIAGLLALALAPPLPALFVYVGLLGISHGAGSTSSGAIWAERYGGLHLGAIRSMNQAIMVIATAAAPLLLGFLLDRGVGVPALALGLAAMAGLAAVMARLGSAR